MIEKNSLWNFILSKNHILPSPTANKIGIPILRTIFSNLGIILRRLKNCRPITVHEKDLIKDFIKSYLKDDDVNEILNKAEKIENNSNQLLNYTNIIKKNSMDIKKDIIEHLWKVIISDNTIDQYESNLMRRICGLIYFPDKECAEIKLKLINYK